ncbi:hypothetical protein BC936DRAFT_146712 [Jimgerdemannia flammicorona]|uniref:Uncharacterized protein n=2 Tax=Jimgerdemannia flammicorona TaxID=994334 RepID=A0A433D723_9FUNG|nr:hypothetical protein BC936DRAFT_146712 [Jimgerdemannia flammicorona]RUS33122.1 hypothetical protein BC938DRAFT_472974 [Jimgerdemannia flammicorona]
MSDDIVLFNPNTFLPRPLTEIQMSGMMGLNGNQDDMFTKLEDMRSIITEVNNQFKDPVSIAFYVRLSTLRGILLRCHVITRQPDLWIFLCYRGQQKNVRSYSFMYSTKPEHDDVHLCVHLRIPVSVRDGAHDPGADGVQH